MKRNEILTTLINDFFLFDDERGNQEEYSIEDFVGFLNAKSERPDLSIRKMSGENKRWSGYEYHDPARDISILIVLMNRYAKWYIKKVLKDSLLQTPDEFSFLITLMTYDSLTKGELISRQIMEKTSGTEVINRLVRKKMISESPNQADRRSTKVSISQKGRHEIMKLLPLMSKVTEIVAGDLSAEEINTLSYLLKKLDHFHNNIYMTRKEQSVNDLLESVKNKSS